VKTVDIFDVIAKDLSGRKSEFTLPQRYAEWFLNTGLSPRLTGLPHHGVPYFFISQTYDTSIADELLATKGVSCPSFKDYAGHLLDFVEENPEI